MKSIATWIQKDRGRPFDELVQGTEIKLINAREMEVSWGEVKGLLLTGGTDISAQFLHQPVADPTLIREADEIRDAWEFAAVREAISGGMPILAICRGHQVLNVALGGTLRLDIPGHNLPEQKYGNIQELRTSPSALVRIPYVNSSHHQAIDQLGENLSVEAWQSSDNIIEQVRLRGYPYCLGVQYHPERDVIYRPIFETFFASLA